MYQPTHGAIAGGDNLTAEAGNEILKAGGNAFDAAVAATLMSFVASSTITSLAGGGYMLASTRNGNRHLLDFFVQTPITKRPVEEIEFYPAIVDFGDKKQEFHVGLGTSATPGNLAGLFEIHKRFCKLPFKELTLPAIDSAKNGVKLHKQTKYQADILKPILTISKEGRDIYTVENSIKQISDSYKLPLYADFLDYIGKNGPDEFYKGEIAQKITKAHYLNGGHLTMEDFLSYQVIEREPFKISYKDFEVITNAPPNSGGPLIAFTLSILNQFSFSPKNWGGLNHLNALANAIEYTSIVRKEKLEKNIYNSNIKGILLDEQYLHLVTDTIKKEMLKSGNTTHVSVADEYNNFVSITTSVGEGCGYYIDNTQIMMNNMLGEEDLNPNGFHNWIENTRLSSMMSPTLLSRKNKTIAALGSGGSNRIRSAIVQAISNYVDFKMDPETAVNEPRIHWEKKHLDIEPGYDMAIAENIKLPDNSEKIYWSDKNMYFGGVHAVFKDNKGNLIPAGDKRRVGAVRRSY